jgi:hypothetical protein
MKVMTQSTPAMRESFLVADAVGRSSAAAEAPSGEGLAHTGSFPSRDADR